MGIKHGLLFSTPNSDLSSVKSNTIARVFARNILLSIAQVHFEGVNLDTGNLDRPT